MQTDSIFCHVGAGKYSIRCMPGVVPQENEYQIAQRNGMARKRIIKRPAPGPDAK